MFVAWFIIEAEMVVFVAMEVALAMSEMIELFKGATMTETTVELDISL